MKITIIGENHSNKLHANLKLELARLINSGSDKVLMGLEGSYYDDEDKKELRKVIQSDNVEYFFGIEDEAAIKLNWYLKCYIEINTGDTIARLLGIDDIIQNMVQPSVLFKYFQRRTNNFILIEISRYLQIQKKLNQKNKYAENKIDQLIRYFEYTLRIKRDDSETHVMQLKTLFTNYQSKDRDEQWRLLFIKLIEYYHDIIIDKYKNISEIVNWERVNSLIESVDNREEFSDWHKINSELRDPIIVSNILDKIEKNGDAKSIAIIIGSDHIENLVQLLSESLNTTQIPITSLPLDENIDFVKLAKELYSDLVK